MTFHARQLAKARKETILALKEEGLTNREIGERLGCTTPSVRSACKDADKATQERWQIAYEERNGKPDYRRYRPTGRSNVTKDTICRTSREK